MKISVIGSGYVGLVSAACLADIGNEVLCIDIDERKIKQLRKHIIPIYEPGLSEMVKRNALAGRLKFTTQTKEFNGAEIIFIAVGTPAGDSGQPDISSVLTVAKQIGQHVQQRIVVVNKSTVPVGTARKVESIISRCLRRRKKKVDFAVVSNPEFLKEGAAINDFMVPDRIVIGSRQTWATKKMQELYSPFVKNGHPILVMTRESSEMSKYASNAILACKISFMNQLANLCEYLGADIELVREAMSLDPRIGNMFLHAGVGYGGSCFPKDVQALIAMANNVDYHAPLLEAVETINERQKLVIPNKVRSMFNNVKGKKFAIWGLSFKPQTDDTREAPALTIISSLLSDGAEIVVYDPKAMVEIRKRFGNNVSYAKNMYAACRQADALLVVTEWSEFHEPNFNRIKKLLKHPVIFDGRNIYNPDRLKQLGFRYSGIGR